MCKLITFGGDKELNYRQNYNDLMNSRKALNRTKSDGVYYEGHHIIPKSMGGCGESSEWRHPNIVLLTAREHYLAHYQLWKIYQNEEMNYAFWCMNTLNKSIKSDKKSRMIISARTYERLRTERSKFISESQIGEKNHSFGKRQTIESNIKRSLKLTGKESKTKGIKQNEEWAKKSASNFAGKKVFCVELEITFNTMKEAAEFAKISSTSIGSACKYGTFAGGYHWRYIEEIGRTNKKRVICLETMVIYDSIKEAEELTGCHHSGIIKVCKGLKKKVNGLSWKYFTET
jgi:hypothetical protein